jgi:uncharacterized protein (DUF1800 family)
MIPTKSKKTSPANTNPRTATALLAALVVGAVGLAAPHFASGKPQKQKTGSKQSVVMKGLPATELSDDDAIVHALNRLGYGPKPGDVEYVKQVGLAKWIDQQLHPETLNDSPLDARLQKFPTLTMSSQQLEEQFPQPKQAAKREGITVEEYRKQQQERIQQLRLQDPAAAARQNNTLSQDGSAQDAGQSAGQPAGQPADMAAGQGQAPTPAADANPAPMNLQNYDKIRVPQRVVAELSMAKVDRAIYSERQLYEQMVDFWFNHFNVFAGKGADRWLLTSYERDAIRPNAMGKFRDLLEATAKSPAMLFYLDNWQSADPDAAARLAQQQAQRRFYRPRGPFGFPLPPGDPNANPQQQQQQGKKQERGLNENYGRELMELHTLGVDGGYTQQDVVEVARAFTGWTIRTPLRDPEFWFNDRIHDAKPKMVMGRKIDAGGMKDGEEVLDLLARDPHTAQHISFEIAQHFVSDNPPDALVQRMAQTFQASDGDIRAVLHTMIYSPEFWSRDAYRAKVKTPFELVVSAARAIGADVNIPLPLVQWTNRIGEPLYACVPPTGYSTKAQDWVNTGALLNRLNYSLALASNRLRGTQSNVAGLLGTSDIDDPGAVLNRAIAVLLSDKASPETRQVLEKQLNDPQIVQASLDDPVRQVNAGVIAGLVLGAPEFQRR